MSRTERRQYQKAQRKFAKGLPEKLTEVPREEFPDVPQLPAKAWRSRHYVVQLWQEGNQALPSLLRLSISRSTMKASLEWEDGLTWDELQAIKRELGFGNWYGVEVYPVDSDVINVSNMRHLWLLPAPLPIGWFNR